MSTYDDRNQPLDPFKVKPSIDDCSVEEWSKASKNYWDFLKPNTVYDERSIDPADENLFQGSLFDDADDGEEFYQTETQQMLDDEERFERVVEVLGAYEAISYCHGMALYALINPTGTTLEQAEVAKLYTARMHRLLEQTKGINW